MGSRKHVSTNLSLSLEAWYISQCLDLQNTIIIFWLCPLKLDVLPSCLDLQNTIIIAFNKDFGPDQGWVDLRVRMKVDQNHQIHRHERTICMSIHANSLA